MRSASTHCDTLAPHHRRVESHYLNPSKVRLILGDIRQPVLVVGAGQRLILEQLPCQGLRCDGVELTTKMIEHSGLRRGLTLVLANASEMPFLDGAYETIILATGLVDFMADLQEIETVMREAYRIVSGRGDVFVAFYSFTAAQKCFLSALGLLGDDRLRVRAALVLHRLGFGAPLARVAEMAKISTLRAVLLCITTGLRATKPERASAIAMRRVLAQVGDPDAFIEAVPETQPYRDELTIGPCWTAC